MNRTIVLCAAVAGMAMACDTPSSGTGNGNETTGTGGVSDSAAITSATTSPTTSAIDPSGGSTGDPSGGSTDEQTTGEVDECAQGLHNCHADAMCTDDADGFTCTCLDGFTGDGRDCEAMTSCADAPCDTNAECNDVADGFACTCATGYSGDGFSCEDVDECANNVAGCDENAACSNMDGGFSCDCVEGFAGDGFSCMGTAVYGDPCADAVECASGLCIGAPYEHCGELCNQAIVNDCPNVGAAGFCVPIGEAMFSCVGDLDTGLDPNGSILGPGDAATRSLNTLNDVDLFHLALPAGDYTIAATPNPDDDIQLEFYNGIGQPVAISNNFGAGGTEGTGFGTAGGVSFVVVRNIGVSTGTYLISATPN